MLLAIVWNIVVLTLVVYLTGRYAKDPEFQACRMPIYEQVNTAAIKWMREHPEDKIVPWDIQQNGHTEHQCRLCGRSKFRHIFYNA